MASNATQFAFIVHRGMGCDDESATDEEQAEKILYYYPEGTDLNEQLNKINMVEGLIDFATKFSVDSINSVVMQQYTWVFSECEKDIWIILAVDSQLSADNHSGLELTFDHQPNTYAMESSLRNLYTLYHLTFGSIQWRLTGGATENSSNTSRPIEQVKTLRKKIRKLKLRLRQEMRDLQSLVDREKAASQRRPSMDEQGEDSNEGPVEHLGIRDNTKTIAEVQKEIDTTNDEIFGLSAQLQETLSLGDYTPYVVRESLAKFMRWYMQTGDLDVHTSLSAMKGMRVLQSAYADPVLQAVSNCTLSSSSAGGNTGAMNSTGGGSAINSVYGNIGQSGALAAGSSLQSGIGATAGSSAFSSTVLRLRETIEEATMKICIGSVILYDGRLLWSDLDAATTGTLVDFVLAQDRAAVRAQAARILLQQDARGLLPPAATGPYAKRSSNPDAELEMAVLRSLGQYLTHRGFVSRAWEVLNLEETRVSSLLLGTTAGGAGVGGAGACSSGKSVWGTSTAAGGGAGGMSTLASTSVDSQGGGGDADSAQSTDVTTEHCEGPSQLYCPNIYTPSTGVSTGTHHNSGEGGGGGGDGGCCIGRAVVYKQGRATIVVMLPAWSSEHGAGVTPIASAPSTRPASPLPASALTENSTLHHAAKDAAPSGLNYKRCAVRRLIADLRLGHRKLANLKAADYLEYVTRYEKSATTDPAGELRSEHSASNASLGSLNLADFTTTAANTATVPAAGCISTDTAVLAGLVAGTTTAAAVDQMAVVVHENRVLNHACLLTLCCQLQMALGPECQRLEKAFKTIQYCDETGSVLRNGGNATLGGASGADSSGTGGYGSSGGGGSSGGSSAGSPFGQSASASASASSASAAAAYERLACAITIAEELGLGATRPELPLSPTLRHVRFLCFNPVDCSLKVCGINSADLSPLLCSPRQFRDLVAQQLQLSTATTTAGRNTSSFVPLNQQQHQQHGGGGGNNFNSSSTSALSSRGRKIAAAVVDKLTDRQGFRFPATSALLSECLEPAVVRALNDIWVELSGKEMVGEPCSHPVLEACLRVSTPQRGGVWVTGRRIGDRYLYMIIDRCVTMNDMYHAFEHLTELLQK